MKLSWKNLLGITMIACCLIYVSVSIAGVPNTFSPGSTAKSSEVNANFAFVNYGNIVVKANGAEIGTYLGGGGVNSGGSPLMFLTPQGYVDLAYPDGTKVGLISSVSFTTSDCTGTPIVSNSSASSYMYTIPAMLATAEPGSIVPQDINTIYYVPMSAPSQTFTINSIYISTTVPSLLSGSTSTCQLTMDNSTYPPTPAPQTISGYELVPNDPNVTGASASYTPPITIQRR
jgi:hypothetical protein